jgi:translation initiation factor IF-1
MIVGNNGLQLRCENIKNQLAQISGLKNASDPYAQSIQES